MNNIKDNFSVLLNKPMDRKEFLRYIAAAGLFATGAGAIVQSLTNLDHTRSKKPAGNLASSSYGTSAYGGVQAAAR